MSRRLEEILLRKELLRSRCALDRLEFRSALAELRAIRPWGEAARVLSAPRVKGRLVEIAVIAIGSTRLRRVSRWVARGVLAWRAWSLFRALRARGAVAANASAQPPSRPTPSAPDPITATSTVG